MRVLLGLVCVGALLGCASQTTKKVEQAAPEPRIEWPPSIQGVITVDELRPRSDIVILPPAMEHVVWMRGADISRFDGMELPRDDSPIRFAAPELATVEMPKQMPRHECVLLEDEWDPESEIGKVPMCLVDGNLDPCDNPHLYKCAGSKGDCYCVYR